MRVKKADLRKRLPQLPINYPGPDVIPFDYEAEKAKVENLCKRLADNEVDVRDAVLAEIPRFLKEVSHQFLEKQKADQQQISEESGTKGDGAGSMKKRRLSRRERLEMRIAEQRRNFLGIDEDELSLLFSKLSLGLFYCYWHSDKPLVQHACAASISRLMHYPETWEHKLCFLRCFLRVLSKKWTMIDQWRIDKYMSLARKVTYECLRFLLYQHKVMPARESNGDSNKATEDRKRRRDDDTNDDSVGESFEKVMDNCIALWQQEVVLGTSAGLAMHLADLFLDELIRAKVTDTRMFTALAKGIPIFIMQKGNNIEKRVVDHFFVPIAGGALEKLLPTTAAEDGQAESAESTGTGGKEPLPSTSFPLEAAKALVPIAKQCSVSSQTQYGIRPLFSECQMYLEHYLEQRTAPEEFEPENEKDKRLRLSKEIEGASRTMASRQEVVAKKLAKRATIRKTKRLSGGLKTKGTTRRKKQRMV